MMVAIVASSVWLVPFYNTGLRPAWVLCLSKEKKRFFEMGEHHVSLSNMNDWELQRFYHKDINKCQDAKVWDDYKNTPDPIEICTGGHH